jgi:hypothetical protein
MDAKFVLFFNRLDCAALSVWQVGMIRFLRPSLCLTQVQPRSHSAIAHATDVMGRSNAVLNLKEKKKPFFFFRFVEDGG